MTKQWSLKTAKADEYCYTHKHSKASLVLVTNKLRLEMCSNCIKNLLTSIIVRKIN